MIVIDINIQKFYPKYKYCTNDNADQVEENHHTKKCNMFCTMTIDVFDKLAFE